jgi:hypothetical protein
VISWFILKIEVTYLVPFTSMLYLFFSFDSFYITNFQTIANYIVIHTIINKSRSSSGSIVSDYGLDDWAVEVRSPTGTEFSSSPCVQTGSGAHPASYPMGTGGKARPGRDTDHSLPSSAEVKNE